MGCHNLASKNDDIQNGSFIFKLRGIGFDEIRQL